MKFDAFPISESRGRWTEVAVLEGWWKVVIGGGQGSSRIVTVHLNKRRVSSLEGSVDGTVNPEELGVELIRQRGLTERIGSARETFPEERKNIRRKENGKGRLETTRTELTFTSPKLGLAPTRHCRFQCFRLPGRSATQSKNSNDLVPSANLATTTFEIL